MQSKDGATPRLCHLADEVSGELVLAFLYGARQTPPMRRRSAPFTQQDTDAWEAFARLVRPLPGRVVPAAPADPPAIAPTPLAPARAPLPRRLAPLPILTTGVQPAGLDNASWSRFRSGRIASVRTLDLHGKTVQAAYQALLRFLHAAQADRIRCVEIITGRGRGEGTGAIRRELPIWLTLPAIRPLILAAAHPHAANEGATRLLLRRPRA